jgi:elongation factor G
MGELHLDIKVDILKRTHGVEVEVGKPQVAYRETITKRVEDSYTHKKQTGGSGQFAKIDYVVEPARGRQRLRVRVQGGRRQRAARVLAGRREGLQASRTRARWPATRARLQGHPHDGGFHAVDSSAIAFEIAAKAAYRQTMPKAGPQLLEPIMKVDVFTPEDHVGDVIGDLNRRRGMIKAGFGPDRRARQGRRSAREMFGYIGDLRTMTSGRGQFSMEFSTKP